MPRLRAARILMVAALLLMTLLIGFPAGRGLGAVSHAGQPTLGEVQQELDQCRNDLAQMKAIQQNFAGQYKKAMAGDLIWVLLPDAGSYIPVNPKEWQALISLDLIEGKISPNQYDKLQAKIRRWQSDTLANLKDAATGDDAYQQKTQQKCAALERQRNQLLGGGTIFKLVPGATKVENTHVPELTIDPAGGTATEKHCCDGGSWDVTYTWKVPDTVVVGTKYQVPVSIKINKINPENPNDFGMEVLAQGFAEQYRIDFPQTRGGTKTFEIDVPSYLSGAKEYGIQIDFVSSSVTYTYRP